MMKKMLVLSLFGLLLAGGWSSARALEVTVTDADANYLYLSAGETYTGQFDIGTLFADDTQYSSPFDIRSASVSFDFADDSDIVETSCYITSNYTRYTSYSFSSGLIYTSYHRSGVKTYSDEYESIQVEINGDATTAATTYSTSESSALSLDGVFWQYYNIDYYYTDYSVTNSGYTGSVSIDRELSSQSLSDLSLDGILSYTVTALSGDIYLRTSSLTVDLAENTAPVPEPATILLFGGGFATVFWVGRGRRKK